MNKVTVKETVYELNGDLIQVGATLNFRAKNRDNKEVKIADVPGIKVLSIFPDINTRICDMQTVRISEYARKAKHIHFISITRDPIAVINQWCAQRSLTNLDIWSDLEYGEFGNQAHCLITNIKKLARGFIVLDEQNKIIDIDFVTEISSMPNFTLIDKYL